MSMNVHRRRSRRSTHRVVLAVIMSAGTVDPLSSVPVYQQVAAILRARIASGELAPDRPVPSEASLSRSWHRARDRQAGHRGPAR